MEYQRALEILLDLWESSRLQAEGMCATHRRRGPDEVACLAVQHRRRVFGEQFGREGVHEHGGEACAEQDNEQVRRACRGAHDWAKLCQTCLCTRTGTLRTFPTHAELRPLLHLTRLLRRRRHKAQPERPHRVVSPRAASLLVQRMREQGRRWQWVSMSCVRSGQSGKVSDAAEHNLRKRSR